MSRFRRRVETSYSADIIGFTTRLCMGMLTKLFKTIDAIIIYFKGSLMLSFFENKNGTGRGT